MGLDRQKPKNRIVYLGLKKQPRVKRTAKGWRVDLIINHGVERKTKAVQLKTVD